MANFSYPFNLKDRLDSSLKNLSRVDKYLINNFIFFRTTSDFMSTDTWQVPGVSAKKNQKILNT